jgi:hypothetical protein
VLCERFATDLKLLVESSNTKAAGLQTEFECLPAGSSIAALWKALKRTSEAEAETMTELSIQLKEGAAKHTEFFTSHRKTAKLALQDMSETRDSISRLEGVVDKSRQANDASFKSWSSAEAAPTGMLKKMTDSAFLGKFVKGLTDDRSTSTAKNTHRSHNDYVMQLTAANVQRRKYFDLDLPEMLDKLQELHVNVLTDTSALIEDIAGVSSEAFHSLALAQQGLADSGQKLNGNHDITMWMAITGQTGGEVFGNEDLLYVAPQVDGKEGGYGKTLNIEGDEAVELGKHMWMLDKELAILEEGFQQKNKEHAACVKMLEVYKTTPSFGSPGDAFRQTYATSRHCRNLQTKMQRDQSIITLMKASNVNPIEVVQEEAGAAAGGSGSGLAAGSGAPASQGVKRRLGNLLDWGKTKTKTKADGDAGGDRSSIYSVMSDDSVEDWGDDDDLAGYDDDELGSVISGVLQIDNEFTAVALYDYFPQNPDELALFVGNQVQVTDTSGDWWSGAVEGRSGIFPETYVRRCDPTHDFAFCAVYDYDAMKDDELGLKVGDLLALLESTEDGWSRAIRAIDGAVGMVPTQYMEGLSATTVAEDGDATPAADESDFPTAPTPAKDGAGASVGDGAGTRDGGSAGAGDGSGTSGASACDGAGPPRPPPPQSSSPVAERIAAATAGAATTSEPEAEGAFGGDGDKMLADLLGDSDDGEGAASPGPTSPAPTSPTDGKTKRVLPSPPPTGMSGLPPPRAATSRPLAPARGAQEEEC